MAPTPLPLLLMLGSIISTATSLRMVVVEEGVQEVVQGTTYSPEVWDGLKLICKGHGGTEDLYEWKYEGNSDMGAGVIVQGGEITFNTLQYGSYECFAKGDSGVAYSLINLTAFPEDEAAKLVIVPKDMESDGEVEAVCKAEVVDIEVENVEYRWTWNAEDVDKEAWSVAEVEGGGSRWS